jgi:hypothetical protein
MKPLIIEDLPDVAELDRRAMSCVHGGIGGIGGIGIALPLLDSVLTQFTQQEQSTSVVTGASVAFAQFMKADVKPTQIASNTTVFNLGGLA